MSEAEAIKVIAHALSTSLSFPSPIQVKDSGFRIQSRRAEKAKWLKNGKVLNASFPGWGPSFQQRTVNVQIVVDLGWSLDQLIKSVMEQAGSTLQHQRTQRARANAKGVPEPLDSESFLDFRRLDIDVAAAHALIQHFGSDVAVSEWLRTKLSLANASYKPHEAAPTVRVHSFTVAVPFLLGPLHVTDEPSPLPGQPHWTDNDVRILRSDCGPDDEPIRLVEEAIEGTPLSGRPIVHCAHWPMQDDSIRRWRARQGIDSQHPDAAFWDGTEWRVIFEPRLISLCEAFG